MKAEEMNLVEWQTRYGTNDNRGQTTISEQFRLVKPIMLFTWSSRVAPHYAPLEHCGYLFLDNRGLSPIVPIVFYCLIVPRSRCSAGKAS